MRSAPGHGLRIADKVRFWFAVKPVVGRVTEIGGRGRRLYGIGFNLDPTTSPDMYAELRADEVERVTEDAVTPAK